MEFGPIKPLIYNVMLPFLEFCYNNLYANYGIAIIILTFIIKIAFFPLMQKQYKSMKAMQAVSPELQKIRDKHKDNPQKLQQEMMQLYKKHKINPLSGCLPMLVQIPFFIAIYSTINSEAFKALVHSNHRDSRYTATTLTKTIISIRGTGSEAIKSTEADKTSRPKGGA